LAQNANSSVMLLFHCLDPFDDEEVLPHITDKNNYIFRENVTPCDFYIY